ncbi:hypothetical protein HII31_07352, partial [Pseudocercospora fuligena]
MIELNVSGFLYRILVHIWCMSGKRRRIRVTRLSRSTPDHMLSIVHSTAPQTTLRNDTCGKYIAERRVQRRTAESSFMPRKEARVSGLQLAAALKAWDVIMYRRSSRQNSGYLHFQYAAVRKDVTSSKQIMRKVRDIFEVPDSPESNARDEIRSSQASERDGSIRDGQTDL